MSDISEDVTWLECYDESNTRYWIRAKVVQCRRRGTEHFHFYGERHYAHPWLTEECQIYIASEQPD